ncbi:MAG: VWA domain-containing protein [Deltaproteobacteria bacterium]|nr:VWA domain-containing protein [Deltaproteobacteria bacterium]
MRLLAPVSLAWLGLVVPLVLLYVLRRRREERSVGSTLLWEAALRDLRAERPWRRLIPYLSLLLQILVLLAAAFALARPAGLGAAPSGAQVAVVIDRSASMATRTRLERAQEVARGLLGALPPGGRGMLVGAGRDALVEGALSSDQVALVRAVNALRVEGGRADLDAAVALAAERLAGAPSGSRVLLLTDGAEAGSVTVEGLAVPVEVRRVGAPADNTGLVALDVRADPSPGHPDRASLFVRLRRAAETPREVFVLASVGDALVASRRVELPARGERSLTLEADLPPDASGRAPFVSVRLTAAGGATAEPFDAQPLDDLRVAPSPGLRRLPVFLVGRRMPSVERVLRSDADVELFETTLARLAEREDDSPLDGLVIYAGELPAEAPPGDSIVVAPEQPSAFELQVGAEARGPRIVSWNEDDPRMRFVSMADVHLGMARPLRAPGARTLVETDVGPVVVAYERPSGETTFIGFDPARSDWPTQPSFVVFFRDLLERARMRRARGGVPAGGLGVPLSVPAPEGQEVTVTTPAGESLSARSRGGVALVSIGSEPGVYRVEAGGRSLAALRNLDALGEVDLQSRISLTGDGEASAHRIERAEDHRESWPWLALLGLVFVVLEAGWATRRGAA